MSVPARSLSRSRGRAELLADLIAAVTEGDATTEPLELHDRGLGDPTVALLDAWATVGDVVGFYLDRIADEGYLSTAREPSSVLALAGMLGHRPRPGLAAGLYLSYTLQADADDKAVLLPAGLLSQSVPGPGELPQTFETATALLTRPSWNTLPIKRTAPLTVPADGAGALQRLVVAGTTNRLSANDVILLSLTGEQDPALVRVASAAVDAKARQTTVVLQPLQPPPPDIGAPQPESTIAALDELAGPLSVQPAPPPRSANVLTRGPTTAFSEVSDSVPRLLAALRPEIASNLYTALATTPIGTRPVSGASVLRVKAAPFGAQAPPRQLVDDRGQPAGIEELPIEQSHALEFRLSMRNLVGLAARLEQSLGPRLRAQRASLAESVHAAGRDRSALVVEVSCESPVGNAQRNLEVGGNPPWSVELGPLGTVNLSTSATALEVSYTSSDAKRLPPLKLTASLDSTQDGVVLQLDGHEYTWDPSIRSPIRTSLGDRRLGISWPAELGTTGPAALSIRIETPLTVANPRRLTLDGRYDTILRDSYLVIDRAQDADPSPGISYPVIARVISASPVVVTRYGMTAKVTELQLDRPWIGEETLTSSLRVLTVRAQPDSLSVQPVPREDDVNEDQLELDRLVAGMEPGHLLLVTGKRSDVLEGTSVTGGEVAMVANVTQGAAADGGEPHTTLRLATGLGFSYVRSTVRIHGNVVAAHQGATLHEVLGSGTPSEQRQSFTLSTAPLLAGSAEGPAGWRSTLSVLVDGLACDEVQRIYSDTPSRSFVTGLDARGHTTITFAGPLPPGNANVVASYRAGDGRLGNVRPGQVTQLLSRPLGVTGVTNPLAGTGGTSPDGSAEVRDALPAGLRSLGRIVSISDYADFARSWANIGKATARTASGGGRDIVLVTVAGDQPVAVGDAQCESIGEAASASGDPQVLVRVLPAGLLTIVLVANVTRDPRYDWDSVAAGLRSALAAEFGYANRKLGEDVVLSDVLAAAHRVPGVLAFGVRALALVPTFATATELADRLPQLLSSRDEVPPVIPVAPAQSRWREGAGADGRSADAVAYLDPSVADTLLLMEMTA